MWAWLKNCKLHLVMLSLVPRVWFCSRGRPFSIASCCSCSAWPHLPTRRLAAELDLLAPAPSAALEIVQRQQRRTMASSSSTTPSSSTIRRRVLPDGVWPTMITPFTQSGAVDWKALDILTEWYIRSGVAGIFSICLSSEMFQLSNEERVGIARRVVERAAGRVPVVAGGTFEGGVMVQASLMNDLSKYVDAVVIITNQIANMEDSDEVWLQYLKELMELTGNFPLGFYETPMPKVRSLTPEIMKWAAGTGRFVFHKDTSLNEAVMLEKLRVVKSVAGTPLKFFTAKVQFLTTLLDNGGNGFSGTCPNFFPWMPVWLCQSISRSAPREKQLRMQRFLSVSDRVVAHKYPTSSKYYLKTFYDVPMTTVSRIHSVELNQQDAMSQQCTKEWMEELCADMGISPVNPMALADPESLMEAFKSSL